MEPTPWVRGQTSAVMADLQTTRRMPGTNRSALFGASNCLRLAAAPTFAVMALLTAVNGSPMEPFCSMAHQSWHLTGMMPMYWLMSIFHSPPWLNLAQTWRAQNRRGGGIMCT